MPSHSLNQLGLYDEALLRPREVAVLFGVRPSTIARWAREGRLAPVLTPGGHRRYRPTDVRAMLNSDEPDEDDDKAMADDAVRLYQQGWSIRQVAARFECGYGVMRRTLKSRVTLRTRSGLPKASSLGSDF